MKYLSKENFTNLTENILSIFFILNISNLIFLLINSFGKLSIYEDSFALFNLLNKNSLEFLLETHNGHIIFISKFLNLIFSYFSLSPTGYNITISIMILFSGLFFIRKIIYLINPNSKYNKIFFFLTSYFWISPWQWENLIWEFQIPWFLISLLVIVLTFINFDNHIKNKSNNTIIENLFFVISPLLAVLSSGQGICYVNCLFISVLNKKRKNIFALFSCLMGYLIFFYLRFSSENFIDVPSNLSNIFLYIIVIISTVFKAPISAFNRSSYKEWIIPIFSSILFQLYITTFIFQIYLKRLKFEFNQISLYIPIIFGLQFAILTSISRSHFGIHQAAVSRYFTSVNLIPIGLILIFCYLNSKNDKENNSSYYFSRYVSIRFFSLIIMISLIANTNSIIKTIYQTQIAYNTRIQNLRVLKETCSNEVKNNNILIESNFSKLKKFHGVNFPPLPDANKLENFKKYLNSNFCEILNSLD